MYVIIRPVDLECAVDFDDFNPNHLTYNARIYYDKADSVYYSDDLDEVDTNKMLRVK